MVFCGKCGYQLTAGNTVCPRCGTPTDPDVIIENTEANNPTMPSSSILGMNRPQPGTQGPVNPSPPAQQQPLILRPQGSTYVPDEQLANEATSMVGSPPAMPQTPVRPSYPGYVPQSGSNYPQQRASYPGYATPAEAERTRARGRVVGLLLILLGLLLILGAMVLFLVTHNNSANTSLHSASFLIASLARMTQSPTWQLI